VKCLTVALRSSIAVELSIEVVTTSLKVMSNTLDLAFLHADACGFSAAMAASADSAIARLKSGQSVFERSSHRFGGRVVNMVGDSVLLAFESVEAAYQSSQHALEDFESPEYLGVNGKSFDYRMGITKGRVIVHDSDMYGHSINMAARIGSLVGRNNVGVEQHAWSEIRGLTSGVDVKERILFAKPDEPHVDFFEICKKSLSGLRADHAGALHNAPVIVIAPQFHESEERQHRQQNEILESFVWNCATYFSTYGWQVDVVNIEDFYTRAVTPSADYMVKCRANALPLGFRLYAAVSSRFMRNGTENFTRDSDQLDKAVASSAALASLVGSAISHAELERASSTRGAGSHQLVAAGRATIAGFSAEQFQQGMAYLNAAQKLDPDYPLLLSSFARAHAVAWRFGWVSEGVDHLGLARELAIKASRLAPTDARCEADLGFVKFWAKEPTESAWHYERSIDTLPYHPELSADAGMVFSYVGQKDQAASVLERSIANLPTDADYRLWSLGDVFFAKHDYRNSLKWLSRMADQSQAQRLMAANKARLGLDPSEHVAKVLALQPDFSVRHWTSIQPFTDEGDRMDFEEALLLAGLPP
jgi:adenylate cyclase